MNKKITTICLFIVALTIIIVLSEIIVLSIYKHNRYSYKKENAVKDSTYETKYKLENVIIDLFESIRRIKEGELNKIFISNAKIATTKLENVSKIYDLKEYEYDLFVEDIYCLSDKKQIYSCKYILNYSSNVLADGADMISKSEKDSVTYENEIVVKLIDNSKYKVLYSKFDLGGGEYYEK